jgi:hypothetical protein
LAQPADAAVGRLSARSAAVESAAKTRDMMMLALDGLRRHGCGADPSAGK